MERLMVANRQGTNDTADHPSKQIKRDFASSRNSLLVQDQINQESLREITTRRDKGRRGSLNLKAQLLSAALRPATKRIDKQEHLLRIEQALYGWTMAVTIVYKAY
jgi:hypothetical protein